jgi:hypothetical protein
MANNQILISGLIELHLAGEGGAQAVASMTKIIQQAKEVEKATGGVGSGFEKGAEKVGLFESSIVKLGASIAGVFAAGKLAAFLQDSYLGFARLERASGTLRAQIEALGGSFSSTQKFIKELGDETGQLDGEMIPALSRLVLTFQNVTAAQEALTLAAQFAEAGFGTLQQNAAAIAQAFQTGMFRSLTDFGIKTKDAAGAAIDVAKAIDAMREKAKTFADRSKDAQDRVEGWRRAWNGFANGVGSAADAVVNSIIRMKEAGDQFFYKQSEGWKKHVREMKVAADTQKAIDEYNKKQFIGPREATLEELARIRADELAKEEARKKAIEEAKAEKERLENVENMTLEAQRSLIEQVAAIYEDGTNERLNLELALIDQVREKTLVELKRLKVDIATLDVFGALFDEQKKGALREFINATGPAPGSGGPATTELTEEQRLQLELDRIAREATVARLAEIHDLRLTGAKAAIDEEADLQRAAAIASFLTAVNAEKTTIDQIIILNAEKEEKLKQIEAKRLQWQLENARMEQQSIEDSTARTGTALAQIFNKHKGFAIGMAIMQTSQAIMSIWADPNGGPWYVKLAETIAMAAEGAAQIQQIRSATITGGGGVSGGHAGSASSPTTPAAAGSGAAPPAFTPGANASGMSVAPMTQRQFNQMAGGGSNGGFYSPSVTVVIDKAFGDDRAMTKLAREVKRKLDNQQWALR